MSVVERNADAVQSLLRKEFGIGCREKIVEELGSVGSGIHQFIAWALPCQRKAHISPDLVPLAWQHDVHAHVLENL